MRVAVDAVLQGHHGSVRADSADHPRVASMTAGDFVLFAGDPAAPYAKDLVPQAKHALLVSPSSAWTKLIHDIHGDRITAEDRYDFSSDTLAPDRLDNLRKQCPAEFEIRRIDAGLASRIGKEVGSALVHNYASPEDFVQRGVGFCALHRDRIVCGATSYLHSHKSIEIEIDTLKDYRRKGLATSVAATLIRHCLNQGIDPHWDAGGSISADLAKKLGYRLIEKYEMYFV